MFKLIHKNKNGTFKVIILNREVSNSEMNALCNLASNIVPEEDSAPEPVHYGPKPPGPVQQSLFDHTKSHTDGSEFAQNRLGEKPVESIKMGNYTEQADGVRLKMIHLIPRSAIMEAVKALRGPTDISVVGCKEIIYGNYPCPILKLEVAQAILEKWRGMDIYAKIVPAHADAA